MQPYDEIIWLKERLDIALNAIAQLQEENQRLKDEIATLKEQKPRPKIPPSALEGAKSKDKQNDKNKISREKHPRHKKTAHLEIHAKNRIKPESILFAQLKEIGVLISAGQLSNILIQDQIYESNGMGSIFARNQYKIGGSRQ